MMRRSEESQRGQALVEFTIASLTFFAVFFGMIQFTLAIFIFHTIGYGVEQATRYAMVRGSKCTYSDCPANDSTISNYAKSKMSGIDTSRVSISVSYMNADGSPNNGCKKTGCRVQVSGDYNYDITILDKAMVIHSASQEPIAQ